MWWRTWHNNLTVATLTTKQMTQTMKVTMEKHLKLNEYTSYPHTNGRMGAMAIDGPIGVGVFVAIVCVSFLGVFWQRCVFWHSCVCSCVGGGWLLSTETL